MILFYFSILIGILLILSITSDRKSHHEEWQEYHGIMHELADKIEYSKQDVKIEQIREKYVLKQKQFEYYVENKYSQTKNCVDTKTYGLLLKQLEIEGLSDLILESSYKEMSGRVVFSLRNVSGTCVKHIVNEELVRFPNAVGQYDFMRKLIEKWYDKQKELERNPYYDILER